MHRVLRAKLNGKYFYMFAEKFVLHNQIHAVEQGTNLPIDSKNLSYVVTEIINGTLAKKPLGYIADVIPGNYKLYQRSQNNTNGQSENGSKKFSYSEISIVEMVYQFF